MSLMGTLVTAGVDVSPRASEDLAFKARRVSAGGEAYLMAAGRLDLLTATAKQTLSDHGLFAVSLLSPPLTDDHYIYGYTRPDPFSESRHRSRYFAR